MHVNKGKTLVQSLSDRTDYAKNPEKTDKGELVTGDQCDPMTVDEEFLLSKHQYEQITGHRQRHEVIAYQIRQSSKPSEVTTEEATSWDESWRSALPKVNMPSLLPSIRIELIFTTTSCSIPLLLTGPGSSKTSGCPVLPCSESAT